MASGTVKFFNQTKGFGFISVDGGDQDCFVHISDLEKSNIPTLSDNQKVNFEITEQNGKKRATDLSLAD